MTPCADLGLQERRMSDPVSKATERLIRDYLKAAADKLDAVHDLPPVQRSIAEMRLAEQMRNFAIETA
jgi:hypothetical protein